MGLQSEFKPTDYKYKLNKKLSKSFKTHDDYPYDWFLEGVDSCQVSLKLSGELTVNTSVI